jgi:hypothetical protein
MKRCGASRTCAPIARREREPMSAEAPRKFEILGVETSARLRAEELAAAAGITLTGVTRLIDLGVIEPLAPGRDEFSAAMAPRLRRVLRLWSDLDVNLTAAAIIADLVERLERAESELERLRRGI